MTIDEKITRKGYLEMALLASGKTRKRVARGISLIAYNQAEFKDALLWFRVKYGNNSYAVTHEINKQRYGRAKNLGYIEKSKF